MGGPTGQALSFLISTLFDLYIMVVAVRFLMQLTRANYYNPLAQAVVKLSNPALIPLRRVVPGVGGQDVAALVLCLLLIIAKMLVFKLLSLGVLQVAGHGLPAAALSLPLMAVLAPIDLLNIFINVLMFAMLVLAVMSWVAPNTDNPAADVLGDITRPVIEPVRRWIKPMAGLDFSLMAALLLLQVIKIIVIGTLLQLAVY